MVTDSIALYDAVPSIAVLEQEMNSIERLRHYSELEQEAASLLPTDPEPQNWPTHGALEFKDVQLRYRPDLPLVLKGLDFAVRPGEKVGIIGRTGAGKTSLVQAVYRTVELAAGSVSVDGVDLRSLGLGTVSRPQHSQQARFRLALEEFANG